MKLDEREDRILSFVVRNYVRTAEPVSSFRVREGLLLEESPATIRSIVAELDRAGFLEQPHVSAGRVPTDRAYRYFVDNLMSDADLRLKEALRIQRAARHQLEEVGRFFADALKLLSIVKVGRWHFSGHGFSGLLKEPELKQADLVANIGYMLDHVEEIFEVYRKASRDEKDIFIGRENPFSQASDCGVFYLESDERGRRGAMILVGPKRMDYEKVSNYVDYLFERS